MNLHYHPVLICILLTSCTLVHEPIPEMKLNSPEKSWRAEIIKLKDQKVLTPVNDREGWEEMNPDSYLYNWKLKDTTITTTVSFNEGNIPTGVLRSKSFDLRHTFNQPRNKKDVRCDTCEGFDIYKLMLNDKVIDISVFKRVYAELVRTYGKEDSIHTIHDVATNEVFLTEYCFHRQNSRAVLQVNQLQEYYEYKYYNVANLTIYTKDIDSLYNQAKAEVLSHLTIDDYCQVIFDPVYKDILTGTYGSKSQILVLHPSQLLNAALADKRSVKSARGTLQVLDDYNEVLFEESDIELVPLREVHPKKSSKPAAIHFDDFSETYNFKLQYEYSDKLYKLRQAIERGNKLSGHFIPTAVLLDDGTVIKRI